MTKEDEEKKKLEEIFGKFLDSHELDLMSAQLFMMFRSLVMAGFTEEQAINFLIGVTRPQQAER